MTQRQRVIVWGIRGQERFLDETLAAPDLELVAYGSPAVPSALSLSSELACESDLRRTVLQTEADVLWLAAPVRLELEERRVIRERGLRVLSSEPRPMSFVDLVADPEEATIGTLLPLFRRSPGYRLAHDSRAEFGALTAINVVMSCDAATGSLFARLFDTMDTLRALCSRVEHIDAALASGQRSLPETLADMEGHLTANVRFPEGVSASIALRTLNGPELRRMTIWGPSGMLEITSGGFAWTAPDGTLVDGGGTSAPVPSSALAAEQITRGALDVSGSEPPTDTVHVLAVCEAARLSSLTGQAETPRKLQQMLSRP